MRNKQCTRCHEVKTVKHFNTNKSSSDGFHSYCRECVSEYNKIRSKIPKDELERMMEEKKTMTAINRKNRVDSQKLSRKMAHEQELLHILADENFQGQFKYVPFNNDHIALTDGRIWSLKFGKFMGEYNHRDGYLFSGRYREEENGPKKLQLVHRVIAKTFLTLPDDSGIWEIDHKDSNKHNNSLDNIHYITHEDNIRKAWDDGLMANVNNGKPVNQYTKDGEFIKSWDSVPQAANELNINKGALYSSLLRNINYGQFKWRWAK